MLNQTKGYDEISDFSDQDDVKLPKKIPSERSPLIDNISGNTFMSGQTSVENREPQTNSTKWPQYLAAIIVTIGGFIMGTTLGWTAPAGPLLRDNHPYDFIVTNENVSWIAALMPLGALIGCPSMAGLVDKLGRKRLMIILTIPTLLGWAFIIWAKSVAWIYIGRVLTGFASGSYTVVVPMYIAEIAEKEIRGILGTYFQLQVNAGILFTYVMGSYLNVFGLSIACAIIPVAYLICLVTLIPESPNFYLMKGDVEKARLSLRFFRGPMYQVDQELDSMKKSLAKAENERVPIMKAFQTKSAKRSLFLGIGVMIFQQFTGCNAVIFYATVIFQATGSTINASISTIIIGIMAVIFTYMSTFIIDRLGRKILLLYSIISMGFCSFILGGFFYAHDHYHDVSSIGYVPLVALCVFIIAFSMGFGPIPWILISEIFPIQIKGVACSIVCMFNWIFVFLVTKLFSSLVSTIFIYNTFWLFTFFSVLGTFFVVFIVPETKGKTMEEIQEMFGGNHHVLTPALLTPENP